VRRSFTRISAALLPCALAASIAGCASSPPKPTKIEPDAGIVLGDIHPSEEQLRPLWATLLLMEDGMVYRVGPPTSVRLLRLDADSTGHIAGCPILEAGPVGRNDDWLLAFKSILAKPEHYSLSGARTFFVPDHIVRLYGEGDTITVMTALDQSIFWIHLATKGTAATGSFGEDAEPVKQLIYGALDPVRKRNQSDPQR
jgi:hypothetical protein